MRRQCLPAAVHWAWCRLTVHAWLACPVVCNQFFVTCNQLFVVRHQFYTRWLCEKLFAARMRAWIKRESWWQLSPRQGMPLVEQPGPG
eukprot:353842-Chlamydomonas_euryale.AAC.3